MKKLIVFLIINGIVEIGAQRPPQQAARRTFAESQFDLDPNLPSEDSINIAKELIPHQQFQTADTIEPSTRIRSPSLPANPQPSLPESQPQQQHFVTSTFSAPRAKAYHIIPGDVARSAPTVLQVPTASPGHPQISTPHSSPLPDIPKSSPGAIQNPVFGPSQPPPPVPGVDSLPVVQLSSPAPQLLATASSTQEPQNLIPSLNATVTPNPIAAPSVVLHSVAKGFTAPARRQISSASLWFNQTLPTLDCSQDYRQIAAEFKHKFPLKTIKDVREKRLAEVVEQRLIDCDLKSKDDHWQRLMKFLPKAKISPSEEEECRNGLVQERIACVNLISYICQFIKREYTFRLVPARVIMQEARLAEDGAEKCMKVVRFIQKHYQPKRT